MAIHLRGSDLAARSKPVPLCLGDVIRFRSDRLFQGAVNIDWFLEEGERREIAASSFVFHGPSYHGVAQSDLGIDHGHQLTDTATFALDVARVCAGQIDRPFTLAIAGYGTGKSHLALTLASLLSEPDSKTATGVLGALSQADPSIGSEVRLVVREIGRPCLVVALNGMRSFDLAAEVTRQLMFHLRTRGLDTGPLDELQPRFRQAATLVRMSDEGAIRELLDDSGIGSVEGLLESLEGRNEQVYSSVHGFFADRGMPIRALGGESVRDVIGVACQHYCGDGKPFAKLLILFDEFGRYTEFATIRSHIAGSGALQDLFEAVQANSESACLVGFIQFELNAYLQRVAAEHRNEMLRYVTRYQSAYKAHLSINLETLIAALIEKRRTDLLDAWFDRPQARDESSSIVERLHRWYPQSQYYGLWSDPHRLHSVIRKGCWPLSATSVWLVFYLTAAGKFLQERSALTLLEEVISRFQDKQAVDGEVWQLHPVDLWSESLAHELLASEELGQQGAIAHAYSGVLNQHGNVLHPDLVRVLRAVVLAAKLGLHVESRGEALEALSDLTGSPDYQVERSVSELHEEFNVLEWDEGFKQFDIVGDSVPRTQFLAFLRGRVSSNYDDEAKARLFASKGSECCDSLGDLDSDFAEGHSITTREWSYRGTTSDLANLRAHVQLASQRWRDAVAVDEPRGTVIYCYVGPASDPEVIAAEARKLVRDSATEYKLGPVPILVVLICDPEGKLGQALAELEILRDSLTPEERSRFGHLVDAQIEKNQKIADSAVQEGIKERRYVTCLDEGLEPMRLSKAGTELLERIYSKPVPFNFDGFTTARGNAADSCEQLTSDLLAGVLDHDALISKPPKVKNRGLEVLERQWGVFTAAGKISKRPQHSVVREITKRWDAQLRDLTSSLNVGEIIRTVCRPPYGANIASAGMLFGVFVAARSSNVSVILNGQPTSVSYLLNSGVFSKRFLDLGKLDAAVLVPSGEASTQWEELLDEWEAAATGAAELNHLNSFYALKARVPLPQDLLYRAERLKEKANATAATRKEVDNAQDRALSYLEKGSSRDDVEQLSWGASQLAAVIDQMEGNPIWSEQEVARLRPFAEEARQKIIELFPRWLKRQMPLSDTPGAVGEFTSRMTNRTGENLKRLRLDELSSQLESHTQRMAREAELAASARQLLRDVDAWIRQHSDALRVVRLAQIRDLESVGNDYQGKLTKIAARFDLDGMDSIRESLANYLDGLVKAKSEVTDRAMRLWDTELKSREGLEDVRHEVESLVPVFEGCADDLEDLQSMRKGLVAYGQAWNKLSDLALSPGEFDRRAGEVKEEIREHLGGTEPLWPVDETFQHILEDSRELRSTESSAWTSALLANAESLPELSMAEANNLYERARKPPPFLEPSHRAEVNQATSNIEAHLNQLAVAWLLERFQQLPAPMQEEFLRLASKSTAVDETQG